MPAGSANPPAALFDADAIMQLFVARFAMPLRCLRERFGVQPAVMPEVDAEVRSHLRHQGVADHFKKATQNGLIRILDVHALRDWKPSFQPSLAEISPNELLERSLNRASEYHVYADLGEAYTVAAAVELDLPAVSNDATALRALRNNGLPVPVPTLRSFDVVALCVQCGVSSNADADEVRTALRLAGESMPHAFRNAKFADGVSAFAPRIFDGSVAPLAGTVNNALRLTPV